VWVLSDVKQKEELKNQDKKLMSQVGELKKQPSHIDFSIWEVGQ
jgi:hypothetical protein